MFSRIGKAGSTGRPVDKATPRFELIEVKAVTDSDRLSRDHYTTLVVCRPATPAGRIKFALAPFNGRYPANRTSCRPR
jgi:hypothetical protein